MMTQATIMPELSQQEFDIIRKRFQAVTGIALNDSKKMLVAGRLNKRLKACSLNSYQAYIELLNQPNAADERQLMVDLLTTNETHFFREPSHFEFLAQEVLNKTDNKQVFRLWSAACSSGQEPYSLAMLCMDKIGISGQWEDLGSDVSQGILNEAQQGLYPLNQSSELSKDYLHRYCLRGVRSQAGLFLIKPQIRKRVKFSQINLNHPLPSIGQFDVILLRNILIYYQMPMKQKLIIRVLTQLKTGGYLILGHAESLLGVADEYLLNQLETLRPSVYRKK